ncbi:hypothetical protein T03_7823 [Trichinella britovi]|uniref:Uncharacterized protein n=1 Tax=Trichinella britovi TaxID=45882 RepID=A0A0V1C938_TRIBR|nr:hypothetical protein T03_7823 [Trichinella britovi]
MAKQSGLSSKTDVLFHSHPTTHQERNHALANVHRAQAIHDGNSNKIFLAFHEISAVVQYPLPRHETLSCKLSPISRRGSAPLYNRNVHAHKDLRMMKERDPEVETRMESDGSLLALADPRIDQHTGCRSSDQNILPDLHNGCLFSLGV